MTCFSCYRGITASFSKPKIDYSKITVCNIKRVWEILKVVPFEKWSMVLHISLLEFAIFLF